MNLLPFDELSRIEEMIWAANVKENKSDILDSLFDFFLYSYVLGKNAAEEMLGKKVERSMDSDAEEAVDRVFEGRTWFTLVSSYCDADDVASIIRVAETEMHRDYNTGTFETAKELGATTKTWRTMEDDKVRDAHWPLDGVTIPINDKFFTDGYEARFPGDFGVGELDCNCRCTMEVS